MPTVPDELLRGRTVGRGSGGSATRLTSLVTLGRVARRFAGIAPVPDLEEEDLPRRGYPSEQERTGPAERRGQDFAAEPGAEGDEGREKCHGGSITLAG